MTSDDIALNRLYNQSIAGSGPQTPAGLVDYMGAMQAQDFAMAKWAIGVRMPWLTMHDVDAVIDTGEILRTHILRPTWHFVSATVIRPFLKLTAPRILASMTSRHRQLEIDDKLVSRSNKLITAIILKNGHATRNELVAAFKNGHIPLDNNRAAHLLLMAELGGLICSGKSRGGKPTYALFEERVPRQPVLTREDALALLTGKFFVSHGPATIQDFAWWSGLQMKEARQGLQLVSSRLLCEKIGADEYWFAGDPDRKLTPGHCSLLPAWDEFLVSYKDRTAVLPDMHHKNVVSSNGIFHPVIVQDGKVIGKWRKIKIKGKLTIGISLFHKVTSGQKKMIYRAVTSLARFHDLATDIQYGVYSGN